MSGGQAEGAPNRRCSHGSILTRYSALVSAPRVSAGIPYRLFQGCSDLVSLQTSGIRVIGHEAFSGSSLQQIDLDESVELIGLHAFPPSGWRDHPYHYLTSIKMPCLFSPSQVLPSPRAPTVSLFP